MIIDLFSLFFYILGHFVVFFEKVWFILFVLFYFLMNHVSSGLVSLFHNLVFLGFFLYTLFLIFWLYIQRY